MTPVFPETPSGATIGNGVEQTVYASARHINRLHIVTHRLLPTVHDMSYPRCMGEKYGAQVEGQPHVTLTHVDALNHECPGPQASSSHRRAHPDARASGSAAPHDVGYHGRSTPSWLCLQPQQPPATPDLEPCGRRYTMTVTKPR